MIKTLNMLFSKKKKKKDFLNIIIIIIIIIIMFERHSNRSLPVDTMHSGCMMFDLFQSVTLLCAMQTVNKFSFLK